MCFIEHLEERSMLAATSLPSTLPPLVTNPALQAFLTAFEGYKDTAYNPLGSAYAANTIGIGSLIASSNSTDPAKDGEPTTQGRNKLAAVFGAKWPTSPDPASPTKETNYESLLDGTLSLTSLQVQQLFYYDMNIAYKTAQHLFQNLAGLTTFQQIALVDFTFNVTNPSQFRHFIADVNANEWLAAAYELANSARYTQLPGLTIRSNAEIRYLLCTTYNGSSSTWTDNSLEYDVPNSLSRYLGTVAGPTSWEFTVSGAFDPITKSVVNTISTVVTVQASIAVTDIVDYWSPSTWTHYTMPETLIVPVAGGIGISTSEVSIALEGQGYDSLFRGFYYTLELVSDGGARNKIWQQS